MARVRFELNRAEVYRTATEPTLKLVKRASRRTVALAKTYTPVDTGRLRSSIGEFGLAVTRDSVKIKVGSSRLRYALAIHEGARARVIVPRRAKALRFVWEVTGREEYFKSVNWPGIGATPYLTTAMFEACVPLGFKVERIRTRDLNA